MCFVGDKVSRVGVSKAFNYRIPKTLKEDHNLIVVVVVVVVFSFFFFFFQKFNEKEKSITF